MIFTPVLCYTRVFDSFVHTTDHKDSFAGVGGRATHANLTRDFGSVRTTERKDSSAGLREWLGGRHVQIHDVYLAHLRTPLNTNAGVGGRGNTHS